MKKRIFATGASLALTLSLGLAGCSATSESKTTLETSVTNEDGTTETTVTETDTTTDEQGNTETTTNSTTTTSGDEDGPLVYTNKELGFEAQLPAAYKQTDDPEAAEGEETVLCAIDDNYNEIVIDYRDMKTEPSYDDEYKWADDYSDGVLELLDQIGEKVNEANLTDNVTLAGAPCTVFEVRSTDADGVDWYRDYFFFLADTDDGPQGLRISIFCKSQEALDELENSFVSM